MSFLAYVLRVKSTALAEYLNVLPEIAVRLMKDCPSEACTMRKVSPIDRLFPTRD